jgi:hypothetical protein
MAGFEVTPEEHRTDSLFQSPMVLFNQVIQNIGWIGPSLAAEVHHLSSSLAPPDAMLHTRPV